MEMAIFFEMREAKPDRMNASGIQGRLQKHYGEYDRGAAPVLLGVSCAGCDGGFFASYHRTLKSKAGSAEWCGCL